MWICGWQRHRRGWQDHPTLSSFPPSRQDPAWPGSSPSGHLGQVRVGGSPLGALFGCLGSQFCLLIEREKAEGPSGATRCHWNQPDSLRTGLFLTDPSLPSVTGEGRGRVEGREESFNPDTHSEKREPNYPWLNCFVLLRRRQSAVIRV